MRLGKSQLQVIDMGDCSWPGRAEERSRLVAENLSFSGTATARLSSAA